MKKLVTTVVLIVLAIHTGYAQEYLNTITQKSCACVEKVPETLDQDQFNMQLGLCMIDASMPFKKQLKKEFDINLDQIDHEQGLKLGKVIGSRMATVCPQTLIRLTQKAKSKADAAGEESQNVSGTITKIEADFFVAFSLKDDEGKVSKYYWLSEIDSETDLASSYTSLSGKQVSLTFVTQQMFDPRINEYRAFQVIKALAVEE
jgi:hypothetical protein